MQSQYCIVYEDSVEPGALCKVVVPAPNWLSAQLLAGLTEEQALEVLAEKDVPVRVLDAMAQSNKRLLVFVRRDQLPPDRRFRNAWEITA